MESTICRCKGCGAPLPMEDIEDDECVSCEYCGTENYISGIEDDEPEPVYKEPPKNGKEIIGRFMDMKKSKQEDIMSNLFLIIVYVGIFICIAIGLIVKGG